MPLFKEKNTRVLILGGGKLGYYLAKTLLESDHELCLIEQSRNRCEFLSDNLHIPVICGDGTRPEVLAKAKAGAFDVFVALTGKDEDNLVGCEIAKKQFGIKRTVSRSNNPKNIAIMKSLGVDIALNTTRIIADMIDHEIDSAPVQMMASISNSNAIISEYDIPVNWSKSGKKIMELDIPENCVMVYIMRKDQLLIPRGNSEIFAGDSVLALTVGSAAKKLKKIFEI